VHVRVGWHGYNPEGGNPPGIDTGQGAESGIHGQGAPAQKTMRSHHATHQSAVPGPPVGDPVEAPQRGAKSGARAEGHALTKTGQGLDGRDGHILLRLLPYLRPWKLRIALALGLLVSAKVANLGVPMILKAIVDRLDLKPGDLQVLLVVPVALLVAYGALRVAITLFTELREWVFARVTQGVARSLSLESFRHLLELSLAFHLQKRMGGLSRDLERGARGLHTLVSYTVYSVLPTLVEIGLVMAYLTWHYEASFAWIALVAVLVYAVFTIRLTEWRTAFRRQMNEQESRASTHAVDALINYETVKIFGNEAYEAERYDASLRRLQRGKAAFAIVVVASEPWSEQHYRGCGHADGVACNRGCCGRHHDARRSRAGERVHDPALHSTQLSRCAVPGAQAGNGGRGKHVSPARATASGGRPRRCPRAASRSGSACSEGRRPSSSCLQSSDQARPQWARRSPSQARQNRPAK